VIFYWAALIVDGWLAVKHAARRGIPGQGRLRSGWRCLPGDLLGRVVMFGCGIPAPTREQDMGDVKAVIVEDARVGRWFRAHAMPIEAQTLGRYVFSRGPLPGHTLAHEVEHIRQWEKLGPLFLPAYFCASAVAMLRGRRPYWDNRFEEAARTRADRDASTATAGHGTSEDETRLTT
jgi:hypothetical protein